MNLFIHWNPNPDFIALGNFSIKWYGALWGLSLIAAFFIERYIFKKLRVDDDKLTIAIQYIFVGGLIGARIAHIVFYSLDYYMLHPSELIAVWKGGLASHGGVVGGLLGLYAFCRVHKEFSFFWLLDHGIISVVLLASLIRLGNLMNSELYGKPTQVPWAFVFEQVDNIPRHAVVLYESIAYLLIQFFMLFIFNRYKDSKPGIYIASFLLLVFTSRFLLEFYKEPDGEMILDIISKTQLLNIPFILTGVVIFYLLTANKLSYSTTNLPRA
ncbi:MAG: prolipoprotein diacylglyceryl transferase [Chitinophagales bacterium]